MGKFNQEISEGDRILLYFMEDQKAVSPGTKGTIISVSPDPFESDNKIINVKWDDGRTLSILSKYDVWKKLNENISEQTRDEKYNFFSKNSEIFENFDWKFLREYLYKLRDSGVVNMFGSGPLLYCGKNHLDRYYGEGNEDNEDFQEVLDMADESKHKMIQGTMKCLEKKNIDFDIDDFNSYIRKYATKIVNLYVSFS